MAEEWIKFVKNTSDKHEVWEMSESLKIDSDAVVGKLLRVWGWFDEHTLDGNAPAVTIGLLDRLVCVTGFCNALSDCGWLLKIYDGEEKLVSICITKFSAHNGQSAKVRAQTAKRAALFKSSNKSNADAVTPTAPSALPRKEEEKKEIKDKDIAANAACVQSEASPTVEAVVDDKKSKKKPKTKTASTKKNQVPYEKIRALYNQICTPSMIQCTELNESRRGKIAARFNSGQLPDFQTWKDFFEYCMESEFLCGKVDPKPGQRRFRGSLEFLTTSEKYLKIKEEYYHDEGGQHGGK